MDSRLKILATRFGQRMFLLFAGCALVPIIALAIVSYGSVRSELRGQAEAQLAWLGKSTAMGLWERLSLLDSEIRILAGGSLQGPEPDIQLSSHFRGLAVEYESSSWSNLSGIDFHLPDLTPEARDHLASGQSLLEIESSDSGEALFLLGRMRIGGDGEPFTVWGYIEPAFLWWGNSEASTLPAGIEMVVLDESRRKRVVDTSSSVDLPEDTVSRAMEARSHVSFDWVADGRKFLSHLRVINLRPSFLYPSLALIVSKPMDLVLEPLNTFERSFFAILAATLLVVVLASIRQIRSALLPLEALQTGTKHLARGHLDTRVEVESSDEFAEVARSFNDMAENLDRQFATLTSLSQLQRAVLSSLSADRIAATVLDRFDKIFPCEHVSVVLMRPGDRGDGWMIRQREMAGQSRQVEPVTITEYEMASLTTSRDFVEWDASMRGSLALSPPAHMALEMVVAFPAFIQQELVAVIVAGLDGRTAQIDRRDYSRARQLADQVAVALSNVRLLEELDDLNWGILSALARAIDVRSHWTAGHTDRVTALAQQIGRSLDLSERSLDNLHRGSLLHDIGKIGVPSEVLDKPAKLTTAEMDLVRQHVQLGVRIIEPIPALSETLPIVLQHHEWFDGQGYPKGLAGEEICLEARILAVADCYDALRSKRPYRPALSRAEVLEYIRQGSGGQFDPLVVDVLLELKLEQTSPQESDALETRAIDAPVAR